MSAQSTKALSEIAAAEPIWNNQEQRRLQRWQLVNYLRVFDVTSNQLVGHIVDINEEGIMMLSEQSLVEGSQYSLRMDRLEDSTITSIEILAKCQWSKQDSDPHFYKLGCSLVEPNKDTITSLQNLIADLKTD